MPAKTIGCKLLGGLGGQLWQIAATAGLAERHGLRQVIPTDWPWRDHFQIPDEIFSDEPWDLDAVELADLRSPLRPYLIDLDLLEPAEETIRHWYGGGWSPNGIPEYHLAIHVRRGDYLDKPQYHPPVSAAWIKEAVELAGAQPCRYVFSDDVDWCRDNVECTFIASEDIFGDLSPDYRDLHYMSVFNAHVISNSSFSWWAAWLAQGEIVVCPRNWYGPAWGLIDTSRFIPADWKQL